MFVVWCWLNGMMGEEHQDAASEIQESIAARKDTPGDILIRYRDEKFSADDLTDEGNAFARDYYDYHSTDWAPKYYNDLAELVPPETPTNYHLPDSWVTFDMIAKVLKERFREWSSSARKRS